MPGEEASTGRSFAALSEKSREFQPAFIGGTKDMPPLAPAAKTTFTFVIQTVRPFTKTKVTVTRLLLEGGKLADVNKNVEIQLEATSSRER